MRVAVHQFTPNLAIKAWLPGETLFSLASRHHIVSCNCFSADTCGQLFGPSSTRPRHDLPCGIDFFVKTTHGQFGEAEEVIFERTLLPIYLPLNGNVLAEKAVIVLRGDRIGSLKYSLGTMLDHFRSYHPLKACELCMEDDIAREGVAYWHRMHQIPGVWYCPQHHCPLMIAPVPGKVAGRYDWCLPRRDILKRFGLASSASQDSSQADMLERFAHAALALTSLAPSMFLDSELLAQVYTDRLISLGLRKKGGKLRSDCSALVMKNSAPLRTRSDLSALPSTVDRASAYVSKLCWRPAVRMHTLLHLFTIVWLFNDWETFWSAAEQVSKKRALGFSPDLNHVPCKERNASYRRKLAEIMEEESRR